MGKCVAYGCGAEIPQSLGFCPEHWARVPKEMKQEVWKAQRQKDRSRYNEWMAGVIDHLLMQGE